MPIYNSGNEIKNIYFKGKEIKKIYFKGKDILVEPQTFEITNRTSSANYTGYYQGAFGDTITPASYKDKVILTCAHFNSPSIYFSFTLLSTVLEKGFIRQINVNDTIFETKDLSFDPPADPTSPTGHNTWFIHGVPDPFTPGSGAKSTVIIYS